MELIQKTRNTSHAVLISWVIIALLGLGIAWRLLLPQILQMSHLHEQKKTLKENLEAIEISDIDAFPEIDSRIDVEAVLKKILYFIDEPVQKDIVLSSFKIHKQEEGEEKEYELQFRGSPDHLLRLIMHAMHGPILFAHQQFNLRQGKSGASLLFKFQPLKILKVPLKRLLVVANIFCATRKKMLSNLKITEVPVRSLKLRGLFNQGKNRIAFVEYTPGRIEMVRLGDKVGLENATITGMTLTGVRLDSAKEELLRMQ